MHFQKRWVGWRKREHTRLFLSCMRESRRGRRSRHIWRARGGRNTRWASGGITPSLMRIELAEDLDCFEKECSLELHCFSECDQERTCPFYINTCTTISWLRSHEISRKRTIEIFSMCEASCASFEVFFMFLLPLIVLTCTDVTPASQ